VLFKQNKNHTLLWLQGYPIFNLAHGCAVPVLACDGAAIPVMEYGKRFADGTRWQSDPTFHYLYICVILSHSHGIAYAVAQFGIQHVRTYATHTHRL